MSRSSSFAFLHLFFFSHNTDNINSFRLSVFDEHLSKSGCSSSVNDGCDSSIKSDFDHSNHCKRIHKRRTSFFPRYLVRKRKTSSSTNNAVLCHPSSKDTNSLSNKRFEAPSLCNNSTISLISNCDWQRHVANFSSVLVAHDQKIHRIDWCTFHSDQNLSLLKSRNWDFFYFNTLVYHFFCPLFHLFWQMGVQSNSKGFSWKSVGHLFECCEKELVCEV
mmetsp:Transcript_8940/g.12302  ORF Transcript_8940/g.12302 Transcript_8940/m.12302 type:complete len:219 (+) Transcript_8940:479-1135(+)